MQRPAVPDSAIRERADREFEDNLTASRAHTDRLLVRVMIVQWLAGIAVALWISPRTWSGLDSSVHVHVWAAVLLGATLTFFPAFLAWRQPGRAITRQAIAVGQMLTSALLIHLTGGRIETHFHVFGSLAFLAFYRDWKVLATAAAVVTLDHMIRGEFWPRSVFGVASAVSWRSLEHAGWVAFQVLFLQILIAQNRAQMREAALRRAHLEVLREENETLLGSERAARAEAEHAGRMKDEFLATLSHELRTPLHSILGWSQILGSARGDAAVVGQAADVIGRNARAQKAIIEDLLDMSRIVAGKLRLEIREVDLAEVVEAALHAARPAADAKDVRLEAVLEPRLLASGDSDRLHQVFWNLLSNALKFSPRGSVVDVRAERVGEDAVVTVSDSGIGIPREFLPQIFGKFSQADSSATRAHGGLGLGLAIVKQLVELHGGSVVAESAGRDQGSTFRVKLPLSAASRKPAGPFDYVSFPAASGEEPVPFDAAAELAGVRVVVVDDEADCRVLVQRVLEDRGASVRTASSAVEAVGLFDAEPPDVLVSDLGMPGEDGYSLIRRIRSRSAAAGGSVPALALTAYAGDGNRDKALAAGFHRHLAKPLSGPELQLAVRDLARSSTFRRGA